MNKNIILLLFALVLLGCSVKHLEVSPKPVLTLLSSQNDTLKNNLCPMEIRFQGTRNEQLAFELSIKNNSADTIRVDPSLFFYTPIYHDIDTSSYLNPCLIKCVDPEKTINKLNKQKDSLLKQVNPYSLASKKTGELIKYGLVTGTIALLTGQKYEDLDAVRKNDEDDWDTNFSYQINIVKKQLDFWQSKGLRPMKLLPNEQITGIVLFPLEKKANEIAIELPTKINIQTFRYQQEMLIH
jgi:hypothetical protein